MTMKHFWQVKHIQQMAYRCQRETYVGSWLPHLWHLSRLVYERQLWLCVSSWHGPDFLEDSAAKWRADLRLYRKTIFTKLSYPWPDLSTSGRAAARIGWWILLGLKGRAIRNMDFLASCIWSIFRWWCMTSPISSLGSKRVAFRCQPYCTFRFVDLLRTKGRR